MISDKIARRLAAEWHGGQTSPLYALYSTGAIMGLENETDRFNDAADEIKRCRQSLHPPTSQDAQDLRDLHKLDDYVRRHGPRGPVADWNERTKSR